MARNGVSYAEVASIATQLLGEGRSPSVAHIRLLLGTGSTTTVANHLRQWKANQESTTLVSAKENIPLELVAVMKGLWERVNHLSDEKIAVNEASHQQTIRELQLEVEKYKTNNQRWQKLYEQWHAEKSLFMNDKLTLDQALAFAQKENTSLYAKQDAFLKQLQDKQERIDELHRLHAQAQANLEHYREAAREQRLLDQQAYEQQKQQLQSEIRVRDEQAVIQHERLSALKQQFQLLQYSYKNLENTHLGIQSELEQAEVKVGEVEKSKDEYFHSSQHWQKQYGESHKILDEKSNQLINLQAEIKQLSQQSIDLKQGITDSRNLNTLLNNEKWLLVQEKAQLEGQLKQMQKLISA
ncbi:MAG: DNA-binding protein [Gammaproteobacteria bacterium]